MSLRGARNERHGNPKLELSNQQIHHKLLLERKIVMIHHRHSGLTGYRLVPVLSRISYRNSFGNRDSGVVVPPPQNDGLNLDNQPVNIKQSL